MAFEADESIEDRMAQGHSILAGVIGGAYPGVHQFDSLFAVLHIVPQLVREPDRSVGRVNDPFGGDFLEQVARTPDRTQKARIRYL